MMAEIDSEKVALRSQINMAQVSAPRDASGELVDGEGLVFTNQAQQNEKVTNSISSILGSGPPLSGINHL